MKAKRAVVMAANAMKASNIMGEGEQVGVVRSGLRGRVVFWVVRGGEVRYTEPNNHPNLNKSVKYTQNQKHNQPNTNTTRKPQSNNSLSNKFVERISVIE